LVTLNTKSNFGKILNRRLDRFRNHLEVKAYSGC